MAKKMLKCIKDVYLKDTGDKAFTKGQLYRPYHYSFIEGYDTIHNTLCVKNDQKERHIINSLSDNQHEDFYQEHFEEVLI